MTDHYIICVEYGNIRDNQANDTTRVSSKHSHFRKPFRVLLSTIKRIIEPDLSGKI